MRVALLAALLAVAGYGYLSLLGAAAMTLVWPRRWWRLRLVLAPHAGWAALVAVGYPLNALLPFRVVAWLLAALALCLLAPAARRHAGRRWRVLLSGRAWREAEWPLATGAAVCALAAGVYARQGALSALLVDSDVEHFADAIAAILHFPIGWSAAAQRGLEATPVGLAYHYVHASLSAVTGVDTFTTELPALFLMLWLAVHGVYAFARSACGLGQRASALACALYALSGLPLMVASFGWGQQTSALASVPVGLAALDLALRQRDARSLWLAGLAAALAADSLYLATAPLVGGAAAALALVAAWRARPRSPGAVLAPLRRVVAIGGIVLAAGALSHLSAASFLVENAAQGFLGAADVAGRSTHVSTFASLPAALGVAPLDLYADVVTTDERSLLRWAPSPAVPAAAAAGGLLVALGLWHVARSRPAVGAVLVVAALYALYLRVLRPFPYGEFKLLSSAWFLAPCLAVAGASWLAARLGRWPPSRPATALPMVLPAALLALYAAGLGAAQWHALRFLSLPWGALLPETELRQARAVAGAVPRGASVFVSNQLTPAVAYTWPGQPTRSRAGFPSRAARANYLERRWRGVVTSLLAFGGRPVYGTVQRYSTELRLPVAPAATDYVLLDAADDARLFGLLPGDLVLSAGTLRLYRRSGAVAALAVPDPPDGAPDGTLLAARVSADGVALRSARGAWIPLADTSPPPLPPWVMPIGESFPGRLGAVPHPAPAPAAARQLVPRPSAGSLVVGLHALRPAHVEVEVHDAQGGVRRRPLAIGRGLTWYTTAPAPWPAEVTARMVDAPPGEPPAVRVAALLSVPAAGPAPAEGLERSDSGSAWPLLSVRLARPSAAGGPAQDQNGIALEAWYTYAGPEQGAWTAQLRSGPVVWLAGQTLPAALALGPGGRWWRAELAPGAPLRQQASDRPAAGGPAWRPDTGQEWLWLDVGPEREPALFQPALGLLRVSAAGADVQQAVPAHVALPLLGAPLSLPPLEEQTMVKGSGDDLFLVQDGRLRWVPDPSLLEQRRIPWRLTVVEDAILWRLPVGLPLP